MQSLYWMRGVEYALLACFFELLIPCLCIPNPSVCSSICNSSNLQTYQPQECDRLCPGVHDGLSGSSHIDTKRLNALELSLAELRTRTNSLVVVVALLSGFMLVLLPVVYYRQTIWQYIVPSCCSSKYKDSAAKCNTTGRPQVAVSQDNFENLPTANNSGAVHLSPLGVSENFNEEASPNSTASSARHMRRPSESSCTDEVGVVVSDPNSSFDHSYSHGYDNDVCSDGSTVANSPAQRRAGNLLPLSAGALLESVSAAHGQRPASARGRRPCSPDSPTEGITYSNATMATTLSCGTLSNV